MTAPQEQLLDQIPVPAIFLLLLVILALSYEAGFRIGRWHIARAPEEKEGPTEVLVASLLALIAFLLAVTIGMAADRFDQRRELVVDQANAIDQTYLRAGYLPVPEGPDSQALLRAYLPLWINPGNLTQLQANFAQAAHIEEELWSKAEVLAQSTPGSVVLGGYIDSLTNMFEVGETRFTSLVVARVPETIGWLLILAAAISMAMVGYGGGLTRRRSPLTAVMLIVVLSAVLTVAFDLDRPREGFIQISQQPLLDVGSQIGAP